MEELELQGIIDKIIYRNKENGFSIFVLEVKNNGYHTISGTFHDIQEKEPLKIFGKEITHPKYGKQIQCLRYEVVIPTNLEALKEYLGSGLIKGIGPVTAEKIVNTFKDETMAALEDPKRLSTINGISMRKATIFCERIKERAKMQNALIFLSGYGISAKLSVKIYNEYEEEVYHIMKENPYQLATDVTGIGFKKADEIALGNGMSNNSSFRIRAGIQYIMNTISQQDGHVYYPKKMLLKKACEILGVQESCIETELFTLLASKDLIEIDNKIYLPKYYHAELYTAQKIKILLKNSYNYIIDTAIRNLEKQNNIELDSVQRNAVYESAKNGVLVLTGGPGTGKTSTTNIIVQLHETLGLDVALAAPTGRAAKRMEETSKRPAQTIHRLLEFGPSDDGTFHFQRNQDNPLEADVVIIDESSMVDQLLFTALLKALPDSTKLILVGDKNQLPSVGAGSVLRDLIIAGNVPVIELTKIFRQAAGSDIIINSHKILKKEPIVCKNDNDFFFIRSEHPDDIIDKVVRMATNATRANNNDFSKVQILTPTRKRTLGVESLNGILQNALNPPQNGIQELVKGSSTYRVGDKVMQISNNYKLEKIFPNQEKSLGVFNGDIGVIDSIEHEEEYVFITFDDGSRVRYTFREMDEIELAYAITIHKSQGGEYPIVIMPVYDYIPTLTTMNLLYTGITRAKTKIVLIGKLDTFNRYVQNRQETRRYTRLNELVATI